MALDREALDVLKTTIDSDRQSVSRSGRMKWVLMALLALLAGGAFWAVGQDKILVPAKGKTGPEYISLAVVDQAPLNEPKVNVEEEGVLLSGAGYVVADVFAKVSSLLTGKVSEILVEEGGVVTKGQIIAKLDDNMISKKVSLVESEIQRAQVSVKEVSINLALAKRKLERFKALLENKRVSEESVDNVTAEVDVLNAKLEYAEKEIQVQKRNLALVRQELEDMVIRAPISGVVTKVEVGLGEVVSPVLVNSDNTVKSICTIMDLSSMSIEVDVNESYIGKVKEVGFAEVRLDAFPDKKFRANLNRVIPLANKQKGTVTVILSLIDSNEEVYPGMSAQVWFKSDKTEFVRE